MSTAKKNSPAGSAKDVARDGRWKGRELYLGRKLLATLVPDGALYRVRFPNGIATDVVNLARAKDAAIALTCGGCQ